MPNYELPKKQPPSTPSEPRPSAELTQEQLMKTMSDILFQRMEQSEVELMKAENAELKQILGNFTENYKKFEGLTENLIRQNNAELTKRLNELHSRQEQKLNALKASNEEVNRNVAAAVEAMKDDIQKDVAKIYDKIHKDTAKSLKNYNDGIKALENKSRRFWAFTGIKEVLFWSMCLAVLFLVGRAMFDAWGVQLPIEVWQFLYPCSFAPIIFYGMGKLAEKMKK